LSVCIQKYCIEDIDERYRAIKDTIDGLSSWYSWCHPDYSEQDNIAWMDGYEKRWRDGEEYSFKITDGNSPTQLGECRLNHINRLHKFCNISYWTRSGYEGRGIATEAVRQAARFGFTDLGLNRLEIFMSLRNVASRKVAEHVGAHREGILRNRIDLRGEIEDAVLYSLIPGDIL